MKVLLVGNGAREHIIAERLAQDSELFSVMSVKNPAIVALSKKYWVTDIHNPQKVAALANGMDVAFASPDAVLAAGVSDALETIGVPIASPLKNAARIEWDKGFMRGLVKDYKISGALKFEIVQNEQEALSVIRDYGSYVLKPLGLTGGKGVKVSGEHVNSEEEALQYVKEVLRADGKLLIEEKAEGEEFSFQAFSDGKQIAVMPPVQDHKRAFTGDCGPNTGGMGSYSAGKLLPFMQERDVEQGEKILRETIYAMKKAGVPFKGVLYGQFMVTADGIRIIEFNSRFGDPEAMNVLSLLKGSLTDILLSIADGELVRAEFEEKASVVKYLVPEGYPDKPKADMPVEIDARAVETEGAKAYFASVYEKDGQVYTTKSRGFGMVGVAYELAKAEQIAEKACTHVKGALWHREDIGTAQLIRGRIEHMKALRAGK